MCLPRHPRVAHARSLFVWRRRLVWVTTALRADLSSLAIGSLIGTAGTLYTALFIFIRYFDKSYAPGGMVRRR